MLMSEMKSINSDLDWAGNTITSFSYKVNKTRPDYGLNESANRSKLLDNIDIALNKTGGPVKVIEEEEKKD